LRQVDAAFCAEVVPEIEAGVDFQEVEAPGARVALEVHLEDALQPDARHEEMAERGELLVVRELEVRTVASEGGISADLAADERGDQLAAFVGEAVEGP